MRTTGFGHYGSYSQRAGYDIIGQAMSGLMSTMGWPGGEPTRTGTAIADVMAVFMTGQNRNECWHRAKKHIRQIGRLKHAT